MNISKFHDQKSKSVASSSNISQAYSPIEISDLALAEFQTWLEPQLADLEARFRDFQTAESMKTAQAKYSR